MGCACAKHRPSVDEDDSPKIQKQPPINASRRRPSTSLNKIEAERVNGFETSKEKQSYKGGRTKPNGSTLVVGGGGVGEEGKDVIERRKKRLQQEANPPRVSGNIAKNIEGEQIAAGWPSWLSQVAGEAIKGWIPRRADSFEKLDKIGQGTYSNVYKARDLDSGKIVALKKVRFDNLEPESVRFMAREIQVLRRLDHPNVVKLEGLVTSRMSCSLYLVFEYMEHDLAGLAACPGIMFTEAQVKCYLQQLLRGLDHCHSRGVLHRDIKGSNLLLDNGGILKIADFGLATFYHPEQKQPLTSRVVTLWYRPPELLLGATEYGAAVDLWSTGCILAELLAGKPIMPGRTEVEQLHKIFKLCGSPSEEYWRKSKLPHATIFKPQQPYKRCIADTFKEFPSSSLNLLDTLLAIEPGDRGSASAALKSEFFTTKPLACDPSSLPQYPPSKEFDAKIREEEARRQRAQGGRNRSDANRRGGRDRISKAVPAPEANAELAASLQKRRMSAQAASKSKSEKFAPLHEDSAVGFPMEPPRAQGHLVTEARGSSPVGSGRPFSISSRSGPQPMGNQHSVSASWSKKHKEEDVRMAPTRPSRPSKSMTVSDFSSQPGYQQSGGDLSNYSSLVAARNGGEHHRERSSRRDRDRERERDRDLGERDLHLSSRRDSSDRHDRYDKRDHRADISYKRDQGSESAYYRDQSHATASHRREGRKSKDIPMGMSQPNERIFHSGPLLVPGHTSAQDYEEFLEEHERQLKRAARQSARDAGARSSSNSSSVYGHKSRENLARSSNGAANESTDAAGAANSNGLAPYGGHHSNSSSHQKRAKPWAIASVEDLDQREGREPREIDKELSAHGSDIRGKAQDK